MPKAPLPIWARNWTGPGWMGWTLRARARERAGEREVEREEGEGEEEEEGREVRRVPRKEGLRS